MDRRRVIAVAGSLSSCDHALERLRALYNVNGQMRLDLPAWKYISGVPLQTEEPDATTHWAPEPWSGSVT